MEETENPNKIIPADQWTDNVNGWSGDFIIANEPAERRRKAGVVAGLWNLMRIVSRRYKS